MSHWKCKKCGTVNNDMVDYCTNCRRGNVSGGCSAFIIIATAVIVGAIAVMAAVVGKDYMKEKKRDSGTGVRNEVRSKEEE